MAKEDEAFTADELLRELRRRERLRRGAPVGAVANTRSIGAAPDKPERGMATRFYDLSEIPSGELAKLLRGRQRAIYGTDDRKETIDVKDTRTIALAHSSAAIVKARDLTATASGGFRLRTTSYQEEEQLCDSEPFATQPLGC